MGGEFLDLISAVRNECYLCLSSFPSMQEFSFFLGGGEFYLPLFFHGLKYYLTLFNDKYIVMFP